MSVKSKLKTELLKAVDNAFAEPSQTMKDELDSRNYEVDNLIGLIKNALVESTEHLDYLRTTDLVLNQLEQEGAVRLATYLQLQCSHISDRIEAIMKEATNE